jgi:hypothetical protein
MLSVEERDVTSLVKCPEPRDRVGSLLEYT